MAVSTRPFDLAPEADPRPVEGLDDATLARMTAQIVSAYLTRNTVPAAGVPQVIAAVREGLLTLVGETVSTPRPEPVVAQECQELRAGVQFQRLPETFTSRSSPVNWELSTVTLSLSSRGR